MLGPIKSFFAFVFVILPLTLPADVGTAFSYQGRLANGSVPIETPVDLVFQLMDNPTTGTPIGSAIFVLNTAYDGGIIQTTLDFGPGAADGEPKWLEIFVRDPADPTDTAPYTQLAQRVELLPVPYSLAATKLTGPNGEQLENIAPGVVRMTSPSSLGRIDFGILAGTGIEMQSGSSGGAVGITSASSTVSRAADDLSIVAGSGEQNGFGTVPNAEDGGDLALRAGSAGEFGEAGDVTISAGSPISNLSTLAFGGDVNIEAGFSIGALQAGNVTITAGEGDFFNDTADAPGGEIVITGGEGSGTSKGGDIKLNPGQVTGTGPAGIVDVAGTTETDGFRLPTGAGAGLVLTSDAAGNGTWQAAAGGSGDGHSLDSETATLIDQVIVRDTGETEFNGDIELQNGELIRNSTDGAISLISSASEGVTDLTVDFDSLTTGVALVLPSPASGHASTLRVEPGDGPVGGPGEGGGFIVNAGEGRNGDSAGGQIALRAGASSGTAQGGGVVIEAGAGGSSSDGGDVTIQTGAGGGAFGRSGDLHLQTPSSQSTTGDINISSGLSNNSISGDITIQTGLRSGVPGSLRGAINLDSNLIRLPGTDEPFVQIAVEPDSGPRLGKNLTIRAGLTSSGLTGNGGNLRLNAGASSGDGVTPGTATLIAGTPQLGDSRGGDVEIEATYSNGANRGGNVNITAGEADILNSGANAPGGIVNITAGDGKGTENGGNINLVPGDGATTGTRGIVDVAGLLETDEFRFRFPTAQFGRVLTAIDNDGNAIWANAPGVGVDGHSLDSQDGTLNDVVFVNNSGTTEFDGDLRLEQNDIIRNISPEILQFIDAVDGDVLQFNLINGVELSNSEPSSGNAGNFSILAADGPSAGTGNAGQVILQGGDVSAPTVGNGGNVSISGGDGGGSSSAGGTVFVTAGQGGATDGMGGNVIIQGGAPSGTGIGGDVRLLGASTGSANTDGGEVQLTGGNASGTNNGGDILLQPGTATGTGNDGLIRADGDIRLENGELIGNGTNGTVNITSTSGGLDLNLTNAQGPLVVPDASGLPNLFLRAGVGNASTLNDGGGITISAGAAAPAGGDGGLLIMEGGAATGLGARNGGDSAVGGGPGADNGNGGNAVLLGGRGGLINGNGGNAFVAAGGGFGTGTPGSASLEGANAETGSNQGGGGATVRAGNGEGTGNGANVSLQPGVANGTGTDGFVDVAGLLETDGFRFNSATAAFGRVLTSVDTAGNAVWGVAPGVGVDGHSLDAADGSPTDVVFVTNSGITQINGDLQLESGETVRNASPEIVQLIDSVDGDLLQVNLISGVELSAGVPPASAAPDITVSAPSGPGGGFGAGGSAIIEAGDGVDGGNGGNVVLIAGTAPDPGVAGIIDAQGDLVVSGRITAPNLPNGSGTALEIDGAGNILVATSSARFKEAITPAKLEAERILTLEPVTYSYKGREDRTLGYLAEQLDAMGLSALVNYDDAGRPYSISYQLIPLFHNELIKKHEAEIESHEARLAEKDADIRAQQAQIDSLKERLERLEALLPPAASTPQE